MRILLFLMISSVFVSCENLDVNSDFNKVRYFEDLEILLAEGKISNEDFYILVSYVHFREPAYINPDHTYWSLLQKANEFKSANQKKYYLENRFRKGKQINTNIHSIGIRQEFDQTYWYFKVLLSNSTSILQEVSSIFVTVCDPLMSDFMTMQYSN